MCVAAISSSLLKINSIIPNVGRFLHRNEACNLKKETTNFLTTPKTVYSTTHHLTLGLTSVLIRAQLLTENKYKNCLV